MSRRGRAAIEEEEEDDEDDRVFGRGTSSSSSSNNNNGRGRASVSHSNSNAVAADQKLVTDNVDNSLSLLEALAKRLKSNKEGMDAQTVQAWQDKIQKLAEDAVRLRHSDALFDSVSNQVVQQKFSQQQQQQNSSSSSSSSSQQVDENLGLNEIKADIQQRVNDQMKKFKRESDPQYVQLEKLCKAVVKNDDEDLVIEDVEMTDAMTKCPFTMQVMTMPYKNNNPAAKCIHHLSKEGLDALLKSKPSASCPTPGCRGKWISAHASLDEAFRREIDRYIRMKESRSQHTQSHSARSGIELL